MIVATCPRCRSRDELSCAPTGQVVLLARPLGSHSLSGNQLKTSAYQVAQLELSCRCGWSVIGYRSDDDGRPHLVEWPPGQTPETARPASRPRS